MKNLRLSIGLLFESAFAAVYAAHDLGFSFQALGGTRKSEMRREDIHKGNAVVNEHEGAQEILRGRSQGFQGSEESRPTCVDNFN